MLTIRVTICSLLVQTSQFALGAVMTVYGCFHFFKNPSFSLEEGFSFTAGCDANPTYIFSCAWSVPSKPYIQTLIMI